MGRKTIPKTTTWARKDTHLVTCPKMKTVVGDNDMASQDIVNSQRMAICLDEPREAQYMAGFIALQMSNITEVDQEGILMPSTEQKVTQSQNVRTRTFRTMEERNQYIRYWRLSPRAFPGMLPSLTRAMAHQ